MKRMMLPIFFVKNKTMSFILEEKKPLKFKIYWSQCEFHSCIGLVSLFFSFLLCRWE